MEILIWQQHPVGIVCLLSWKQLCTVFRPLLSFQEHYLKSIQDISTNFATNTMMRVTLMCHLLLTAFRWKWFFCCHGKSENLLEWRYKLWLVRDSEILRHFSSPNCRSQKFL